MGLLLRIITVLLIAGIVWGQSNRILERDIPMLEFSSNQDAACVRTCPAGKQLQCVKEWGNTCDNPLTYVRCDNMGASSNGRVTWRCYSPGLNQKTRILKGQVACEGYDYAGDPYILMGSCVYRYGMDRVDGNGWKTFFIILPFLILLPYCLCCTCFLCCCLLSYRRARDAFGKERVPVAYRSQGDYQTLGEAPSTSI